MDDGKLIAHGAPKDILAQTNETSLDEAFIALLPQEKRAQHQKVMVRPRRASEDETPAIEAKGLTSRFGGFVAPRHFWRMKASAFAPKGPLRLGRPAPTRSFSGPMRRPAN
jgi:hypothetical protein